MNIAGVIVWMVTRGEFWAKYNFMRLNNSKVEISVPSEAVEMAIFQEGQKMSYSYFDHGLRLSDFTEIATPVIVLDAFPRICSEREKLFNPLHSHSRTNV